jgi:hypothetical protein
MNRNGFPTDKNDRCVFTRDNRGEDMIFFEKNKVLGVEANRVLSQIPKSRDVTLFFRQMTF